ncbi:MAG: hypothetical protein KGL39_06185 [Patescibacteria group bacterium]|nr:hypothetical protein [Patescibacteria group bacterium]
MAKYKLAEIVRIYEGSNGDETKALYEHLQKYGPAGIVALNLFRACKASARAKVYRGGVRGKGSYRSMAYERKQWSMDNLCKALGDHSHALGIDWGWGKDDTTPGYEWVLYIEVATGQISFHNAYRGIGPDYSKPWDGIRNASVDRICRFAEMVCEETETAKQLIRGGASMSMGDAT